MPTSTHNRRISWGRLGAAGDAGRETDNPDGSEIMATSYERGRIPPSAESPATSVVKY
jgi:hypothetical protein